MRKMIFAAMACVALAGCTTTAQEIANTITGTTQTVTEKARQAQSVAKSVCGFVPTISTLVSIFNSGYSQYASVVGSAVCDAVTNLPLADGPGDRVPRVNGVVVRGRFVK